MAKVLIASESPKVNRHSSIDQFRGFLSVMTKGGWTPIVFDQLDGITCDQIKSHPVILSFGGDVGYVFPEAHCTYVTDKYLTYNKHELQEKRLPEIFGGQGEFYQEFVKADSFVNFDNAALGVTEVRQLRTGLSYVLADKNLPATD